MNEKELSIKNENYKITDYRRNSENKNGDLYTIIETVVTTLAGIVVAKKIREYWTDQRLERFYGKDHIFQTHTIIRDDIGCFTDFH